MQYRAYCLAAVIDVIEGCTHVDDGSSGANFHRYDARNNWPAKVGSYEECIALCESIGDDCPQGDYYSRGDCYLYSKSGRNECNPCTPGEDHFVCGPGIEWVGVGGVVIGATSTCLIVKTGYFAFGSYYGWSNLPE